VKFVVSADVWLSEVWEHIQQIQLEQGYAFLVDQIGALIAYRDTTLGEHHPDLTGLPPVRAALAGSAMENAYEYRGLSGQNVVGTAARVDGPGWVLVIERPAFEAYAPMRQVALISLGLLVGACLLAILIGSIVSQRIARPIALLEEGVRKLGSGELTHRLDVRTGDEIGRLASEFNQMVDHLERSHAEVAASIRDRERVYRQAASHAKEMTALHLVALQIGAQLDLNLLLRALVRHAVELLQADAGAVYFAEGQELAMAVSHELDQRQNTIQDWRDEGVVSQVFTAGQPLVINDYPSWQGRVKSSSDWPYAIACVPLFGVQGSLGVLAVMADSAARSFSPDDLDLLNRFGAQAAIAIQNARAYRAEQEAHLLADRLREATLMLGSSLNLDELLEGIWTQLRQVVAYDSGAIFMLEDKHLKVRSAVGLDSQAQAESVSIPARDDALFNEIARTGQALILADAQADNRFQSLGGTTTVRGWMGVPLYLRGRLIGCMTLDKREPDFYRPQDAKAAQAFAAQVAVAIENARLYAEAQQRAMELATALKQRQELDRLRSQFIQNTSHELRTPLTLIRGYAELLESGELGPVPAEQRAAVEIVYRRTRDLSDLVEGLTTILEVEAGRVVLMPMLLQEMAEQTVHDFQPVAGKAGLDLSIKVEGVPPSVQGDARHLRRVFDNLLTNACKFTPSGGRVCIDVRPDREGVRVEVTDTGIGIPPDKLDKVFERFYQVDGTARRRYGGVGLGLALVKEIVEAHQGRVGISSELGRGTTIWFWLPGDVKRDT
jgi:signal transduction histidine kinase